MEDWRYRLKVRMKEQGVSQRELADVLGLSESAFGHYLNGRRSPPLDKFINICTALTVSSDWILFGSVHNSPKHNLPEKDIEIAREINALPKDLRRDIQGAIKVFKSRKNL